MAQLVVWIGVEGETEHGNKATKRTKHAPTSEEFDCVFHHHSLDYSTLLCVSNPGVPR